MKKTFAAVLSVLAALSLSAGPALAQGDEQPAPGATDYVTCTDSSLKIEASNAKPEDLVREIGDDCGIKIVLFGDVFEDKTLGVKFQKMPVRMGIERVLRIANMPNYMLHFDNNTESPRIVELDIMGKKGGERQLTAGLSRSGQSQPPAPTTAPALPPGLTPRTGAPVVAPLPGKTPEKPGLDSRNDKSNPVFDPKDIASEKSQEEFLRVMDEMMKAQESGEEPDPAEVLRIFKEVVPPEIREQIPPDVLKEIEEFEKNPQAMNQPAAPRKKR